MLDETEQLTVERICLDREPEEALVFVQASVAPQLKKRIPCVDRGLELYRGR